MGVKALAIYRDGSKTAQALRTDAQKEKEATGGHRRDRQGGGREGRRRGRPEAQEDAEGAPVDHAQVLDRRPRGLHHGRHVRGRHRRRDLHHRRRQGGLDAARHDELLRHRDLDRAAVRRAARDARAEVRLHALRAGRDHPNPEIPFAKSMPDYIMRWLASRFLDAEVQEELGILTPAVRAKKMAEEAATSISSDTATPTNGGGRRRVRRAARPRRAHRLAAGPAGPHGRPGPRPGVLAVRRHDAAHGLVLHVLQLREQYRLRLSSDHLRMLRGPGLCAGPSL